MLRALTDPSAVDRATRRAAEVLDGSRDLSVRWLQAGGRVAVPEESGLHLDAEQAARLAAALQGAGIGGLEAVAAEPLEAGPTAYALDATPADLAAFSHECGGLAFVLLAEEATPPPLAVLCSVADYLLVAGPRPFVVAYAGDLAAARAAYTEFIDAHAGSARPALRAVLRHFDRL